MRELTEQEKKVINLTVDLWNEVLKLPTIHPELGPEIARSVHDIQARIMARPYIEKSK